MSVIQFLYGRNKWYKKIKSDYILQHYSYYPTNLQVWGDPNKLMYVCVGFNRLHIFLIISKNLNL